MHTSVILLALSGLIAPGENRDEPNWVRDYALARREGRERQLPLAVFIGAGRAGWNEISREGRLDPDVRRVLAENYVCVYVDSESPAGRRLASAFESAAPALVISTFSGNDQAFRHEGRLGNDQLADYLRRYADPDRAVRVTETVPSRRSSFYPSQGEYNYAPALPPGGFMPAFGGGRGGC